MTQGSVEQPPAPADVGATPRVLLWGARSTARMVCAMLLECGAGIPTVLFGADDTPTFPFPGRFVSDVAALHAALAGVTHYVICIGAEHGFARTETAHHLDEVGLLPLNLIHATSFIDPSAAVGRGCHLMPFAAIHKFTTVGDHTIVNLGAKIDHECRIGSGVHVMGSAAIAGRVTIGDHATIGTHATVLPELKIGEGAVVGAGAVVTRDVSPRTVVVGVPARRLKSAKPRIDRALLVTFRESLPQRP